MKLTGMARRANHLPEPSRSEDQHRSGQVESAKMLGAAGLTAGQRNGGSDAGKGVVGYCLQVGRTVPGEPSVRPGCGSAATPRPTNSAPACSHGGPTVAGGGGPGGSFFAAIGPASTRPATTTPTARGTNPGIVAESLRDPATTESPGYGSPARGDQGTGPRPNPLVPISVHQWFRSSGSDLCAPSASVRPVSNPEFSALRSACIRVHQRSHRSVVRRAERLRRSATAET